MSIIWDYRETKSTDVEENETSLEITRSGSDAFQEADSSVGNFGLGWFSRHLMTAEQVMAANPDTYMSPDERAYFENRGVLFDGIRSVASSQMSAAASALPATELEYVNLIVESQRASGSPVDPGGARRLVLALRAVGLLAFD